MSDYSLLSAAVLAAVQAAVPDHTVTLNGKPDRPEDLDAYAIVWCGQSGRDAPAWNGKADAGEMRWQVTSVGRDPDTVGWLAGEILDYLTATRITGPDGWRFAKALFTYGQNPYADETIIGQPNVAKADTYTAEITRI